MTSMGANVSAGADANVANNYAGEAELTAKTLYSAWTTKRTTSLRCVGRVTLRYADMVTTAMTT